MLKLNKQDISTIYLGIRVTSLDQENGFLNAKMATLTILQSNGNQS